MTIVLALIACWFVLVVILGYYLYTRTETFQSMELFSADKEAARVESAVCAVRSAIISSIDGNDSFEGTSAYANFKKAFNAHGFKKSSAAGFFPSEDFHTKIKAELASAVGISSSSIKALLTKLNAFNATMNTEFTATYSEDDTAIAAKPCPVIPTITAEKKSEMLSRRAKLVACALKTAKTETEYSAEMARMGVSDESYVRNIFLFKKLKDIEAAQIGPILEIFLEHELIQSRGSGFRDVESAAQDCQSKSRNSASGPTAPVIKLPTAPKKHIDPTPSVKPASEPETTDKNKLYLYFGIGAAAFILFGLLVGFLLSRLGKGAPQPAPQQQPFPQQQPVPQPIQQIQPQPMSN